MFNSAHSVPVSCARLRNSTGTALTYTLSAHITPTNSLTNSNHSNCGVGVHSFASCHRANRFRESGGPFESLPNPRVVKSVPPCIGGFGMINRLTPILTRKYTFLPSYSNDCSNLPEETEEDLQKCIEECPPLLLPKCPAVSRSVCLKSDILPDSLYYPQQVIKNQQSDLIVNTSTAVQTHASNEIPLNWCSEEYWTSRINDNFEKDNKDSFLETNSQIPITTWTVENNCSLNANNINNNSNDSGNSSATSPCSPTWSSGFQSQPPTAISPTLETVISRPTSQNTLSKIKVFCNPLMQHHDSIGSICLSNETIESHSSSQSDHTATVFRFDEALQTESQPLSSNSPSRNCSQGHSATLRMPIVIKRTPIKIHSFDGAFPEYNKERSANENSNGGRKCNNENNDNIIENGNNNTRNINDKNSEIAIERESTDDKTNLTRNSGDKSNDRTKDNYCTKDNGDIGIKSKAICRESEVENKREAQSPVETGNEFNHNEVCIITF